MGRMIIGLLVAVVLLAGGVWFFGNTTVERSRGGDGSKESAIQQAQEVASQAEFNQISKSIDAGEGVLLDVRTAEEFNAGHITGAKLHSLQQIEAGEMPSVSKDKKVYVYCRSGNRSAQAKGLLNDAGYSNVVDLGGVNDVMAMGGKTCNSSEC